MIRIARRACLAALLAATPLAALAATHEVRITGDGYEPARIKAAPDDTVVFTNAHDRPHTATADDATFDTGRILPGESKSVTVLGPTGFVDRFNPRFTGVITD